MTKQYAYIFPGQGAQYIGMGKDFYDTFEVYRQCVEEASDVLKTDFYKLIFEENEEVLTQTKNSQPAIFLTSIAMWRVMQQQFDNLTPQICAGLSLGEYTALHVSGKLPFAQTLHLVQQRGLAMHEACENSKGTMAVVMGLPAETVEKMVQDLVLPLDLWTANFNCPGQVVISGTQKGIDAGTQAAKTLGAKRVLPLNVHGAFHSGLMKSAEHALGDALAKAPLQTSSTRLVMNVPGDFVDDISTVRQHLLTQLTSPVRWEQGICNIEKAGVEAFIEIGCGSTLSGMNKRIGTKIPTYNIEKVAHLEGFGVNSGGCCVKR